ncbi:MAG TPA: lamin tail domain-containing protein, partial [Ruminococcus sp.]|nr:lamin tail domain-containing protein [Ruminococcus sp.]
MKKLQKITGVLLSAAMAAASMPGAVVSAAGEGSGVRITEICTQNKTSLLDSSGSPADWIELYNGSGSAADMGGWTLSDTSKSWTFPDNVRIGAGEYLIVFADKASSTESELHTGFGLSKSGDTLRLADASGAVVQDITIPGLGEDRTYGLLPGTEDWAEMAASPERENDASVAEPQFSLTSGFYDA